MTVLNSINTPLRLRRLRMNPLLRDLVSETHVNIKDLVLPLFIKEGLSSKLPISSMPGHYQLSLDNLERELDEILELGISSVLLFGIPKHKDPIGSYSFHEEGIIQKAIEKIKNYSKDILVITDACFCEYTDHGHCGVLDMDGSINNDETIVLLQKQAISYAKSGADIIAPSGMMDGMVKNIRLALDENGYQHIPILSYAVKYASSMYGPFRHAAEGAPSFGDRKTHQMNPANVLEALRESRLDVEEGADLLMVKPAHTYLDVIRAVKETFKEIPLAAYHTSGEFSMIKAAAEKGYIDEVAAFIEVLTSIKRAGADIIITYWAKEFAKQSSLVF
jgi:porphobilinogen synthase